MLGGGANGKVYRVELNEHPYEIAIKVTNYPQMLIKEVNSINFINERIDIKLPKIYFYHTADGNIPINVLCMSYIKGIGADKVNWLLKGNRKRKLFCSGVIDNFLKLQTVTNDKYGLIDGEKYDNWIDYYRGFAKERLNYITPLANKGEFPFSIVGVLSKAYDNLEIILSECSVPTLTHGDYWAPNLLADNKTCEFVGCVDPFNLMWAESEYEIFAMILYPNLGLYKEYKRRVPVSKLCDLKARMYSLFSEVYWFELLGKGNINFMKYVARILKKEMKRNGI